MKNLYFPFVVVLVLVAIFLIVQPRTQHIFFPQERQAKLTRLLEETKKQQDINLYSYWEFREFYSHGSFEYEQNGLPTEKNEAIETFKSLDASATAQLLFTSAKITSIGGQTKNKTLAANFYTNADILRLPSVILKEDTQALTVIFLKPISEVRKVNGFLQYQLVLDENRGDMWFEFTQIQKN